jgi:hypothetical protein
MPDFEPVQTKGGWRLEVDGLTVEAEEIHSTGGVVKATVTVRDADSILFRDSLNLTSAKTREDFIRTLERKEIALDERALIALEEATRTPTTTENLDRQRLSQATQLVTLAASAELFHTADGEGYATVPVGHHRETYALRNRTFRRWLSRLFYQDVGTSPSAQAIQDALGVFEGQALFDGPEVPVHVRVAGDDNAIYLDLANDDWEVVQITPEGWRVVGNPPVKFRHVRGMAALPRPSTGGKVTDLRRFVNVDSDADWQLLIAWIIQAFNPRGPYPLLALHGEQGSAKSTQSRVVRALVDPSTASLRSAPHDPRDLMIAASNSWIISLDNLSYLPHWLSDALCRLATGGGFVTRELYTDTDEVFLDAQRPVILNGIEELASRGDLLDRSIILYNPQIPEERRRAEAEFWCEFELIRPQILGALLDAVSVAFRNLAFVQIPSLPRMADFARWVTAAEPALGWPSGSFISSYTDNREAANDLALEASPVASILCSLIESGAWKGTATDLLKALNGRASEDIRRQKAWPKNAQSLANLLRRLAPSLRAIGIGLEFWRDIDRARHRMIAIKKIGIAGVRSVQQHSSPSNAASEDPSSRPTKADHRPNSKHMPDGADGADDAFGDFSDIEALRGLTLSLWREAGGPDIDAKYDEDVYLDPEGHIQEADEAELRRILANLEGSAVGGLK